ncbi:MAG: DUF308 domain-containing protein [Lachnospiraceae bacterium]|nr:DUF308 domain-containing protein [Candidatus Equihabitans merdae]
MHDMKELSPRAAALIRSIILLVGGLVMLFFPRALPNTVFSVAGVIFLLYGVAVLLLTKGSNKAAGTKVFGMGSGAFCLIVGIVLLVFRSKLLNIFPVIFGVIILVNGLLRLKDCYDARRFNASKWWLNLLLALIPILFSLVLIFRSAWVMNWSFIFIGISMLIDGISGLISAGYVKGVYRGYRKTVNKTVYSNTYKTKDDDREA